MKDYNLDFEFDENLHEVAEKPSDLEIYVHEQKNALQVMQNPVDRVKALGEIGTYLRILGELREAEVYLLKSLEIIDRHKLETKLKVTQQIRLAHVYQWQRRFDLSNALFEELIELSSSAELDYLQDFIWQHAGKNYFDQMKWQKAYECFEKALALRHLRRAPRDQLDSTQLSIRLSLQKMN